MGIVCENFPIRVLLVDDHQMFREGVRKHLMSEPDIDVVGDTGSAEEALNLLEQTSPTIVIMDIRIPDMSGIELTRLVRDRWPDVKILILSGYGHDQYVRTLARIGIDGYILKDSPQKALVEALRQIASGGAALPPNIASKVMRSYASMGGHVQEREVWELTLREIEVLELLHQGLRNSEIAEQLSISARTVEVHVGNITSKLGAQSRTDAVRKAMENGLIS